MDFSGIYAISPLPKRNLEGTDRHMTNTRENRGRPLVLESVIVVVSILIAFALDASWDRLQAARALDEEMSAIADELTANRVSLEHQWRLVGRVVSAMDALLEAMDAAPSDETLPVPDTLVWLSQRTATVDVSFGVIDALISSGRLAEVPDPDLRRALAGLSDRVLDAGEELLEGQDTYQLLEAPVAFPDLELRDLRVVTDNLTDDWESRALTGQGDVDFPNNRAVRSAMEHRRLLYLQGLREVRALAEHLDQISAALTSR